MNLIESDSYDNEMVISKTVYKYYTNNLLAEICDYNAHGEMVSKYAYTYSFDTSGDWITRVFYHMDITNANSQRHDLPIMISKRHLDYY